MGTSKKVVSLPLSGGLSTDLRKLRVGARLMVRGAEAHLARCLVILVALIAWVSSFRLRNVGLR